MTVTTKKDLEKMIKNLWRRFGSELLQECGGDYDAARDGFKDMAMDFLADELGAVFWSTDCYHDFVDLVQEVVR